MASRLELHEELCTILETRNVYYQSPESLKMSYPAIKYSLKNITTKHANNAIYNQSNAYELMLIDENPESEYVNKLLSLPYCSFDRFYTADNLNHFVFTLFY